MAFDWGVALSGLFKDFPEAMDSVARERVAQARLDEAKRQFDEGKLTDLNAVLPFLSSGMQSRVQAAAPGGKVPIAALPFLQKQMETDTATQAVAQARDELRRMAEEQRPKAIPQPPMEFAPEPSIGQPATPTDMPPVITPGRRITPEERQSRLLIHGLPPALEKILAGSPMHVLGPGQKLVTEGGEDVA